MPLHGVSLDVPCVRCGRRNPANRWGELCVICRGEVEERGKKLARRIAPAAALLATAWVYLALPPDSLARFYGGVAVLVTWLVTRRIVTRVAADWYARKTTGTESPE